MYCPRCGRQPISDELRFCSYCGFRLGVVKAALVEGDELPPVSLSEMRSLVRQPRQRDINIGVILMFAGSLFATWMAGWNGQGIGRYAGGIILAIFYSTIVLFSGPITKGMLKLLSWEESADANVSASRKGMGFGATLMFISTVVSAISSLLLLGRMRTVPFFIGLMLAFALLLVVGRLLMRGLRYLVTDETVSRSQLPEASDRASGLAAVFSGQSLSSGQDAALPVFGSQRVTTAEIVSPSSITEHTTNLLENK